LENDILLNAASDIAPEPKFDAPAIQRILQERICLLKYKPGDQLKEAELAREFHVSRTPVRDALNRISHLGLIESRNGVGTVVVGLSLEQLHHVYEMRLEFASLIGKLSPIVPGAAHRVTLQELLDRARDLQANFSSDKYLEINHNLNELIASMIGNSSLRSMWLQTYIRAASVWHLVADSMRSEVADALIEELTDLITAVEHGDAEAVGYVQRVHITNGFQKVKHALLD
jgi:DNA-binding GntR family transcriptional regulator